MSIQTTIFDPQEPEASEVLNDLESPVLCLHDIAREHNVTVESLCLWIARPEIQARIAAIDAIAAQRVRTIATRRLPTAANALITTIEKCVGQEFPGRPGTPGNPEVLRSRSRLAICKATGLLLRLARFDHTSRAAPPRLPLRTSRAHPKPSWQSQ